MSHHPLGATSLDAYTEVFLDLGELGGVLLHLVLACMRSQRCHRAVTAQRAKKRPPGWGRRSTSFGVVWAENSSGIWENLKLAMFVRRVRETTYVGCLFVGVSWGGSTATKPTVCYRRSATSRGAVPTYFVFAAARRQLTTVLARNPSATNQRRIQTVFDVMIRHRRRQPARRQPRSYTHATTGASLPFPRRQCNSASSR